MKWPAAITPGRWSTIALVGNAPSSRALIPHIPPETGLFTIAATWNNEEMPRQPDVCLEIHQDWLISHPNYSLGLWEWVQRVHSFPIFTYETNSRIPSGVRYPLKQLAAEFLWPAARGPKDDPVKFFTSSLDYLMALALAYEPERIEVYGFDMGSDTEYRYQREGGHFWYGVAVGRGVEVWIPEDSPMLSSRLYSYEGSQWVRQERLEQLLEQMRAGMEKSTLKHADMNANAPKVKRGKPTPEQVDYYNHMTQVADVYHIYSGAAQSVEQLLNEHVVEGILARQEIERLRAHIMVGRNHHISRLNWFEGSVTNLQLQVIAARKAKSPDAKKLTAKLEEMTAQQNQARMDYFVHNGSSQLLSHLVAECDLQADAEFRPVMDIVSIDMNKGSATEALVKPERVVDLDG